MIKKVCLTLGLCLLFFVLLEGLSSTIYTVHKLLPQNAPGRSLSGPDLQFDSELGWVTKPNFYEKDYYAPGIGLKTNSQGFRGGEDFSNSVPAGKFRVICSGDSQTFGDGAGDDQTWCHVLESLDNRFQTVNMAEIGYGADQMYLHYKGSGAALDHDIHLFAVVTDDLLRMRYSTMGGYSKPVLKLHNGELSSETAAVGKRLPLLHWLALKPNPLRQFRSVALVADIIDWAKSGRPAPVDAPSDEERQLLGKMIESLQAMEKNKNSVLVMVYLPTRTLDYTPGGPSGPWRTALQTECASRGVPVVDLIDDYQKLPITTRDGLFIWPGSVQNFPEAAGHYSPQGHEYIATQVYAKLVSIPEVARKMAALPPSQ